MPLTGNMLIFKLNSVTNPYEAAIIADQLGEIVRSATPRVTMPPDWVLENSKKRLDIARFAVTYCNDPATLAAVARSERRYGVLEALCANALLPATAFGLIIQRSDAQRRAIYEHHRASAIENAEVPVRDDYAPDFVTSKATYEGNSSALQRRTLLHKVLTQREEDPTLMDRLFVNEARFDRTDLLSAFLNYTYTASSDPSADYPFSLATQSVNQVLDVYNDLQQATALQSLVGALVHLREQAAPVSAAVVTKIIEKATPPAQFADHAHERVQLFTREAVDLLVARPEWFTLLSYHELSDAQFNDAYENTPPTLAWRLFYLLDGSRERLVRLLENLSGKIPPLSRNEWNCALRCVVDPHDIVLESLASLSADDVLSVYLSAKTSIEIDNKPAAVHPSVAYAQQMFSRDSKLWPNYSALTGTQAKHFSEEYRNMLLDTLPDMAYWLTRSPQCAPHIYDRLVAAGCPIDDALEYFEKNRTLTLDEICTTLAKSATSA